MRVHTKERPYQCDLCAKSYTQKNDLKLHMSKHTGKLPFPCGFCELSFVRKTELALHVSMEHVEQNVHQNGSLNLDVNDEDGDEENTIKEEALSGISDNDETME